MSMAEQTTRVPLIAGNWKMNLDHLEAVTLVQRLTWPVSYTHLTLPTKRIV